MPRLSSLAASMGVAAQYVDVGTIATATFDLTSVPTSAPVATLTTTTPSGTSVRIVASRSSSDGNTWSAWTAPAVDGTTLASPLARYVQLRIELKTTNTLVTPTLTLVAMTATGSFEIAPTWDWNGGGRWNAE